MPGSERADGAAVKDKQPLMDARKRIESDMERFKICEKVRSVPLRSKNAFQQRNQARAQTPIAASLTLDPAAHAHA